MPADAPAVAAKPIPAPMRPSGFVTQLKAYSDELAAENDLPDDIKVALEDLPCIPLHRPKPPKCP